MRKLGKEALGGTEDGNKEESVPGAGEGAVEPRRARLNSCRGGNDTQHYPAFVQGRDQNAPEEGKNNNQKGDYSGLHHSLLSGYRGPLLGTTGRHSSSSTRVGLAPGLCFYVPQVSAHSLFFKKPAKCHR